MNNISKVKMNNEKKEFWVHTRPGRFLLNSISLVLLTDINRFFRHKKNSKYRFGETHETHMGTVCYISYTKRV